MTDSALRLSRPYSRWTEAQLKRLTAMKKAGRKAREISEATGHPICSVWAKWADLRDAASPADKGSRAK